MSWRKVCWSCRHDWEWFPPKNIYQHRPPIAKKKQFLCYQCREQCNVCKKRKRQFLGCFFWMPLMWRVPWAPCNGTTTPPKLVVTLAPNHSTLRWHPPMAPRPLPQSWPSPSPSPTIAHYNGTTSTPPKLVVTLPPQQWHTTMAPCCPLPQSWSSPSPSPTIAHYNGTLPRPLHWFVD